MWIEEFIEQLPPLNAFIIGLGFGTPMFAIGIFIEVMKSRQEKSPDPKSEA